MQNYLVDSHCHLDRLDLSPWDNQLDGALENAKANQVGHMLCVSIALETFPNLLTIAEDCAEISVSVGVHPNESDCQEPDADELLRLAQHPKVVAIGETGLDYFRSQGDLTWQHNRFREHIQAAKACNKPLIIHTRDSTADTLKVLAEEGADEVGGVMHCFVEDWESAQKAMDLGFYISFSGIVTFKTAGDLREVAAKVPLDRILIETDSPYLAPVPFRGKANQPAYVRHVAACIAELRGLSFERVAELTTDNFFRLFRGAIRPVA